MQTQKSPRLAGFLDSTESLVRAWLGDVVLRDVRHLGHLAVSGLKRNGLSSAEGCGMAVDPHLAFLPGCDHVGVAHDLVELILGHTDLDLAGLAKGEWGACASSQDDDYSSEKESVDVVKHGDLPVK